MGEHGVAVEPPVCTSFSLCRTEGRSPLPGREQGKKPGLVPWCRCFLTPDLNPDFVPPREPGNPGRIVPHQERLTRWADPLVLRPVLYP
jgi:hypothetical protein